MHEIPSAEDILADPSFASYTPEMDVALAPFVTTLQALLTKPEQVTNIQAKTWLENQRKNIATTIIPYTGNLSVTERAQLGNWFEVHVALKDKSLRRHWLSILPFAHTCTLWLAALQHRNKAKLQKFGVSINKQELEAAWELQTTQICKSCVDVDRECLERLEEAMLKDRLRQARPEICSGVWMPEITKGVGIPTLAPSIGVTTTKRVVTTTRQIR